MRALAHARYLDERACGSETRAASEYYYSLAVLNVLPVCRWSQDRAGAVPKRDQARQLASSQQIQLENNHYQLFANWHGCSRETYPGRIVQIVLTPNVATVWAGVWALRAEGRGGWA